MKKQANRVRPQSNTAPVTAQARGTPRQAPAAPVQSSPTSSPQSGQPEQAVPDLDVVTRFLKDPEGFKVTHESLWDTGRALGEAVGAAVFFIEMVTPRLEIELRDSCGASGDLTCDGLQENAASCISRLTQTFGELRFQLARWDGGAARPESAARGAGKGGVS
jgi:hypothetical protein